MKFIYQDFLNFLSEKPPAEILSEKLFQLGHEHEIKDDVFDMPRPSGSNMSYKSIKLENGNYVVVRLVKVSIANPLILYPSAVHDRYLKEMKETANSSFEYSLRKASKVKYNKAIIEKIN